VNWDEFDELDVIGIDEVALTKGRKNFIAIVTTQQADGHVAVLAVLPDRKKKTVRQFLEAIPKRLWRTMETACTDMWAGYTNAAKEFAAAVYCSPLQCPSPSLHRGGGGSLPRSQELP